MYIKQIIIENFKSYTGHHVINYLDPGYNAIVGSNGSGKSTFLDAISFVLTTKYSPLAKGIRKQLISNSSQGTRDASKTAAVQVILSNEDKKLPHESSEISIKRAIDNDKKDRITVNKRVYNQTELREFLQSAFSPNNPYYVVEQDQIARLALASDEKRFEILMITAGIDGVSENLDTLFLDISAQQKELLEKRETMAEYYGGLEAEKDKFKEWDRIDKLKRFLQERLVTLVQEDAEEKLAQIRESIPQEEEKFEILNAKYEEKDAEVKDIAKNRSDILERLEVLENKIDALQASRLKLKTDIQSLTMEQQNLTAKIHQHDQESDEDRWNEVNESIRDAKQMRQQIGQKLKETEDSLNENQREFDRINCETAELIHKKSMIESTINPEEMGMDLEDVIKSQEDCMNSQERIVSNLQKTRDEKEQILLDMRMRLKELEKNVEEKREKQKKMKEMKSKLLNEKKEILREVDLTERQIHEYKVELAEIDCKFRKLVRRDYIQGIESMQRIIKTWTDEGRLDDVEGIKGILADNFTCGKAIQYVAEIKAGIRLFHHLVRNHELASKVLEEMKKQRLPGLISCIPIADISVQTITMPTGNECHSLFEQLRPSSQEAEKVIKFIFGKTMIPRDIETGNRLIQQYPSLNFITLQGHQILKPGMFKGGFNNRSESRIDLYKKRRDLREKIDVAEEDLQKLQGEIKDNHERVDKEVSELQKNQADIDKDVRDIKQLEHKLQIETRALKKLWEDYKENRRNLDASRIYLQSKRRMVSLRGTSETLDASEIDESIESLRARSKAIDDSIVQDSLELSKLQSSLESNEKRMNVLREIERELRYKKEESSLEQLESALKSTTVQIRTCEEALKNVNENLENLEPEIHELQKKLEQLEISCSEEKLRREEARMDLKECGDCLEDLREKSRAVQFEILKCHDEIANLGPIPRIDNHRLYENLSKKALGIRIQKLKKQEEKLGAINRKAAEDFQRLENQLEILDNLISQVQEADDVCKVMLQHVAQVKLETLEFCFKRINEYCQDIFKEIVPAGIVRFEPIWNNNNEANDDDDEAVPWNRVHGIRVRATFSEEEPMKNFLSFSGGQKTVLALVLIFALQKLKPAPFYLFDEIDRVLDEAYRQSIAQMIQRMSENSQFFIITFKKELLRNEGQFFKVETQRGVSRIKSCTRDEAEEVVAAEN